MPDLPPDIAAVALPSDPFTLGVASGDPDSASVVLWTRLAPDPLAPGGGMAGLEPVATIVVDVAPDDTFTSVVATGRFPVDAERGHSVHAVIDGLEPATTYAYRFRVGAFTSPTGSTRTTPAPADDRPVRLALASCQRYTDGHYIAHRDMAAADVDLVVWVGDYVYERETGNGRARPEGTVEEAVDLDGYRQRYAAARLDPDLAANHAAHPWAVTWDDHEVRNDYAGGAGAVPAERLTAAYQAWWEHQPVRLAPPIGPALAIHRALRVGANVELLMLDTRQHRSAAACDGGVVGTGCDELADPGRTMLGGDQEVWFAGAVAGSDARWTAVAQSVVLSRVEVFDSVNGDAWDGYRRGPGAVARGAGPGPQRRGAHRRRARAGRRRRGRPGRGDGGVGAGDGVGDVEPRRAVPRRRGAAAGRRRRRPARRRRPRVGPLRGGR